MLESLIDFSERFSVDTLDSTVLKNVTYAFCNCEPNIWFIAGYENNLSSLQSTSKEVRSFRDNFFESILRRTSLFVHTANASGIQAILRRTYANFQVFYGSLTNMYSACWSTIENVKDIRKRVRKLGFVLQQLNQDLTYMTSREEGNGMEDGVEHDIIGSYKSVSQLKIEIDEVECKVKALEESLHAIVITDAPNYGPQNIREKVARYMRYCMQTGEFLAPSFLSNMHSSNFSPSLPPFNETIRIRNIIQQSFCGNCIGITTIKSIIVFKVLTKSYS